MTVYRDVVTLLNTSAKSARIVAKLAILTVLGMLVVPMAQASTGCQLSATTVNTSIAPNGTANFNFDIVDFNACTGASGNITVLSNTTGGGTLSQPTFSGALGTNINFSMSTGGTPGLVEVTANCTAGCNGLTTLTFRVSTSTYSLQRVSPGTVVTGTGVPTTLQVQALRNGVGQTSVPVNFNATGPGSFTFNPTPPVVTNGTGIANIQFSSPTQGTYTVNGDFCNPDFLPACNSIPTAFQVLVGTSITPKPGNPVSGNASTTTPVIKVTAQDGGNPAVGIPVSWSIQAGDASINTASNVTDSNGDAGATLNLGITAGSSVTLRATRNDTSDFVDIPFTINDDFNLAPISPTTLSTSVGQPLAITTRYLLNGNPNPNTVGYSVSPGGPSLVPSVVTPDGNGDATTSFTSGAVGTYTVTASGNCLTVVPNCPPAPVVYTVNVVNQTLGGGGTLEANPNEALVLSATALDNGTPAAGVTINWSLSTGAATPTNGSSVTDGAGVAIFAVVSPNTVPTTYTYTAVRGDAPSASTVYTVNVIAPTLTLISGNNQTGLTTSTSPLPMVVELRNGKTPSAPLPGKTITWTTLSGPAFPQTGSSVTDGLGRTSVFANFGGSGGASIIQASDSGPGLASVSFNMTSLLPTLVNVSGNGQTGSPGATLAPLIVRAENNATAAPGVTINWTVVSGSATLSAPSSVTDGAGNAQVVPTLAVNGGSAQIRAARADQPGVNTTFIISSTALLSIQSGDGQSGPIGTPGAAPLVARLSSGSSPVSGANVDWQVLSGGGSVILSAATVVTDANGDAALPFDYGSVPGSAVVRASALGGTTTADFTVTALSRDLLVISGNSQIGVPNGVGAPLVVRAETNGSPDANVGISWSVTGPATVSSTNSLTDGSGQSSVDLLFGNALGSVQITATRTDSGASVSFALTVGAALGIVSGNGQSGVPNSVADQPLVISLTDLNQQPISGAPIQWRVLVGNASLTQASTSTDGSGRSSNSFRFGANTGPLQIEASAFDGLVHAVFSAQANSASLSIVAGQGQSGPVGSVLPIPFRIRFSDVPPGNAATPKGRAGVPVTWTVLNGGGSLTQQTNVTDANGEATATLRLGSNRGQNNVRAALPGNLQVEFLATGVLTSANLSIVSGNPQTLPTNTDSDPLVVRLLDDNGQAVDGVAVQWTGNNALLGATSCVTGSNGQCSIRAKVDLPGASSVTAKTSNPNAGPVTFSLTGAVAELDGLNPRQSAIADAIDQACPALAALGSSRTAAQNDLFQRCREIVDAAGLQPDAASAALESLFPDVALVQSSASLLAAQAQQDNLKARLGNLRSNRASNPLAGLSVAGPGGVLGFGDLVGYLLQADGDSAPEIGAEFSRWGFFASGQLGRAEADANPQRPAYDLDINGLTVGVDYRMSDKLVLGGAVGYTRQDADLNDQNGTLDTSGYSLSAYASYYYGNNWYLDSVLTWGRNQFDLDRQIQYTLPRVGGGTIVVDQQARASSDGDMKSVSATLGRDFQHQAWSFGPYARVTYSKFGFDQTAEQLDSGAGSGLGMVLETRDIDSLVGVLGGRVSYTHSASWGILIPTAQLEWESEFKDDPSVLEARFLNDPTNTPIMLSSDPYDQDFLRLGVGLSMVLSGGKSGFIQYERSIGRDGFNQDNLNLGVRIEF
ncbi:autotransporter domain-containing protein [Ahniella affigens]|nr:autotransporter domain-containing protein [Ahniella affigens]